MNLQESDDANALQDELAETQIPDPGYAGTNYEIAMDDLDDFDIFDYWDDLEYGDDSYWEYDGARPHTGPKRKRVMSSSSREN